MHRLSTPAATFAAGLLVFAAVPALAQDQPVERPEATLRVEAGESAVSDLLQRWADARGKVLQLDPQLAQLRLRFGADAALDATSFRHILDFHDVVLLERGDVLEAHHRRNLSQKGGPPWQHVEGLAPRTDELVTCVVPIEHGAGSSIFATVRGLLTRDANRIGNILYVQGPEVIILVDLGHNVRYYQEVIAALDRPPPLASSRARLSVYEVDRAWWTKTRAGRAAPAALADALRAAVDQASLVGEVALHGAEPFAVERDVQVDGQQVRLTLEVGALTRSGKDGEPVVVPAAGPGQQLRLRLDVGGPGAAALRLTAHTTFAAGEGAPSVQTFSGRAGERPTDVVVLIERD